MNRQASYLLIAVLVGVVLGGTAMSVRNHDAPVVDDSVANDPPPLFHSDSKVQLDTVDPAQLTRVVESLASTLNEEISERRLLAQQLQQLQSEVSELRTGRGVGDEGGSQARVVDMRAMDDRFAEMGFSKQDRESIWSLESERQFRAVELDDLARREGWRNTSRYNEELMALATYDNPVRKELGDDRYDRYLYAMGRPNRLVVGSVMAASPAQRAGLKPGDVILRYGGEAVHSNLQLVNMRSSGVAGEPVVVEFVRDGQPMQVTMPRGPMGFGGSEEVIDPRTNLRQGSE